MTTQDSRLFPLILPDILRVPDLAVALHRSESTIRRLIRAGVIPARLIGSQYVIVRTDFLFACRDTAALLRAAATPDRREP